MNSNLKTNRHHEHGRAHAFLEKKHHHRHGYVFLHRFNPCGEFCF